MSKARKTFEAQDVTDLNEKGNANDRRNQHAAKPEAGTNKREKGSVRSAAGEGIPAKKSRGEKQTGVTLKARKYNERSQEGNYNREGGN